MVGGTAFTLPISLRNMTTASAADVSVRLDLPTGWTATPAQFALGTMAAQASEEVTFTVTPPVGAVPGALSAVVTWTDGSGARTLTVPIDTAVSCSATPTRPTAITRVSSEQNSPEEVARATATIDGSRSTFWHTQWDPTEVAHPHQIVFDMGAQLDICAVTLVPRTGTNTGAVNGQIKDYEIYATNDPGVAAQAASTTVPAGWGEPVAAGSLPGGFQDKLVGFDEVVNARYLLLVSKSEQGGLAFTTLAEFTADVAAPDTTAPVVGAVGDQSAEAGSTVSIRVSATDAAAPLTYSARGLPSGVTIDPATGVISGSPATAGTYAVTVSVTDPAGNVGTAAFTLTVHPKPTPTTPDPTTPAPTNPSPTNPAPPTYVRTVPYTMPGEHDFNGRQWFTQCEPYSQTERCRTLIWASVVKRTGDTYSIERGWAFNNLTYLPFMKRAQWATNPLGGYGRVSFNGEFVGTDQSKWQTVCDTAATGRNACRSYRLTTVYAAKPKVGGGYAFSQANQWVFNNIVLFGTYARN